MTTVNLTEYNDSFKEMVFLAINKTFRNNEYIFQYNAMNEITVFFKDEYFQVSDFPYFKNTDVKYLYCMCKTKRELNYYMYLLTLEQEKPFYL